MAEKTALELLCIPYNKSLLYFTRGLHVPITGKPNRHLTKSAVFSRFIEDRILLRTVCARFRRHLLLVSRAVGQLSVISQNPDYRRSEYDLSHDEYA